MGGTHSELCNILAKEIWNLDQRINLYINATHIPGVDNVEWPVPHMLIGFFKDDAEIMLKPSVFASICTDLDNFSTVDLFATRHYKQLPVFSFRKPDPGSSALIDSLSLYWSQLASVYVFPLFSLWGMTPDSVCQISVKRQNAGSVSGMAITALVPQADGSNNASSTSTSKCAIVTTRPHRIELKLLAGKI